MPDWLLNNEMLVWWLLLGSVATFVVTLVLVPAVIAYLPADYFKHRNRRHALLSERHPLIAVPLALIKNALGLILIIAGLLMLVLPGQGIITLLAGMVLLDFPGKYRAERWVIERKVVLQAINWIRAKAGRGPLQL